MSSEQRATSSSAAIPAPTALGPPRVRPSPAATRSTPAAPLPSRSGTGNALGPGTGRSRCPRILHIPRTAVEAPPPPRPSPRPLRAGRAQRRCEPRYRGERSPSGARGGTGAGCGRKRATGSAPPAPLSPRPARPLVPPPPAPVTTAVFLALVMPPGRCAGPRRKEAAAPTLRAALRGVRGARSPSSLRHRAPRLPKTAEGGGSVCV